MSLEAAIQENTAALNNLIAALAAGAAISTAVATSTIAKSEPKTEAKKPDAQTASSALGAKQELAAQKGAVQETADKQPAVDYEQVKAAILRLSKEKGREPTVALLQRHGVTKGPDLKAEQYAQVVADIDAIFAGTYNPEAAEVA